MRTTADRRQDTDVLLLLGLLVMGLGIMPLVNGLYGYYVILPEIEETSDAVNDAAADLGLDEVPTLSTDRQALLFAIMILAGGCMVVGGTAMLSVALLRRRGRAERRP